MRVRDLPLRISLRAIGVDMESVTAAANGFHFRMPYTTLLCLWDKPLT